MTSERMDAPPQTETRTLGPFAPIFEHWTLWLPAIGGFALIAHFWRIGYAPTLSFADLGTVLGALLLFGIVALIVLFALLLWPLFNLSMWVEAGLMRSPPRPSPPDRRLSERARAARNRRAWRMPEIRAQHHPSLTTGLRPGSIVSFVVCGVAALLAYAVVFAVAWPLLGQRAGWAIVVCFAAFGLIEVWLTIFANAPVVRRRARWLRRPRQQFLLLFLIYMGAWPMMLLPFIAAGGAYVEANWPALLLVALLMPMAHWIWYATWRVRELEIWLARLAPILLAIAIYGLPNLLIDAAMNRFGLGTLRSVDLVLTARGCEIAHAAWPQRACVPARRDGLDTYRLDNVDVLTRIGAHVYVAAPGGLDDAALPRFPIPAEEVLSWRRREPSPKPAAAPAARPAVSSPPTYRP